MKKKFSIRFYLSIFLGILILGIYYTIRFKQKLNLVIISVDTLRADHMGIYGYNKNTTPHIDEWAKDAFVFTNAVATVPHTYPSFVSLLTGLHPFQTGVFRSAKDQIPISINITTLAEILKKNNYVTAGYQSNVFLTPELSNLNQGFGIFEYLPYQGNPYPLPSDNPLVRKPSDWLDKNKKQNFFLWVHFMDPHTPYNPHDNLKCTYNEKYCETIDKEGLEKLEKRRGSLQGCQKKEIPTDDINIMNTLYDGEIAASDLLVNEILNKLTETGLDKNTLVVFYGDHGEGFDHNYYFMHGELLYNSSVKIPLIIKHPFIRPGKNNKINQLIDNTDIMPTLLELIKAKTEKLDLDGKSFAYLFKNEFIQFLAKKITRKYAFMSNRNKNRFAIYDGRYKYINTIDEKKGCFREKEELYDILTDPEEQINLIHTKEKSFIEPFKKALMSQLSLYGLPNEEYKSTNGTLKPTSTYKEDLEKFKSLGY